MKLAPPPIFISLMFITTTLFANTDRQLWFGYTQQNKFHSNWGLWLEFQHRTKNNFAGNLHVEILRAGITYYINNDVRVTVGYAFIPQFPSLTNQSFVRLEHRPWQQVFHVYTKNQFRLLHYLRSEQRLLEKTMGETILDGYVFRQRIRYSATALVAFNKHKAFKQGSIGLVLADEVFVNAYSSDKAPIYDQNRAFGGLFYNITNATQLHAGYMNIFGKTAKGNELVHTIRLAVFHNLNFMKNK